MTSEPDNHDGVAGPQVLLVFGFFFLRETQGDKGSASCI
jgi:hypothetical protein